MAMYVRLAACCCHTNAGFVSHRRAAHVVAVSGPSMYTADSTVNAKVELCPKLAEQPNDTRVCSLTSQLLVQGIFCAEKLCYEAMPCRQNSALLTDHVHTLLPLLLHCMWTSRGALGCLYHSNCQHFNFTNPTIGQSRFCASPIFSNPTPCHSAPLPQPPPPPPFNQKHQHLWQHAGGQFTGAALNPARVLGPAIVFHCYWNTTFIYVFGELFGGLLAAIIVLPLYGFGQFGGLLDTRLCNTLGIKIPEKHQHRSALLSALQCRAVVLFVLLPTRFDVWLDEQAWQHTWGLSCS